MKTCTACLENKELSEFYFRKDRNCYTPTCKKCENRNTLDYRKRNPEKIRAGKKKWGAKAGRNSNLLVRYGITLDEYNRMFAKQGGCCAGCNKHQSSISRTLFVDHCHTTGKVRGLLCHKCNTILGMAEDSSSTLINLIKYLN